MADPTPQEAPAEPENPEALKFIATQSPNNKPGIPLKSTVKAPPPPPPAEVRESYAAAMTAGETLGPQDFHDTYHLAGHPPLPDLSKQLPNQADLIDHSIGLAKHLSLAPTPEVVNKTKHNILQHWAETGQDPYSTVEQAKANPEMGNRLTSAPAPPPIVNSLRDTIHILEGSGDDAVSPKGAIGRNQVMPATAKQYGFDPGQLHDPAYNQKVSDAIQADLMARYRGDTQAVLVAYNAGPEVADKWLAAGKDNSVLPAETQKYLAHAARLPDLLKPGRDAIFDPMGTLGGGEASPVTVAGVDFRKVAEALGLPDLSDEIDEHEKKMKELEEAGDTAGMAAEETRDPFLNILGVGNIDGNFAKATIRAARGQAERETMTASAALEKFRAIVNKGLPEFEEWLRTGPGTTAPMWPAPDIMNLIDHVENATGYGAPGVGGSRLAATSPLAPLAGMLRALYQSTRLAIETEISDMSSFYDDYYRHLWESPSKADKVGLPGRLGSSASLQTRTIPTITDGIQRGLIPRFLDPIENTLHYIAGMRSFLAQHRVFEQGRANGSIAYAMGGRAPHDGWVQLKGRFAEKAAPIPGGAAIMRAWAPPGYASVYNNWVGKGFYEWPKLGAVYQKLQFVSNMMTGMKLAFSAYHAWNIAQETVVAGLTNALGELSHGELARGLRDIGMSVTVLPKLAASYLTGRRLQQQYLHIKDFGAETEQLATLFAQAGGRAVGRGAEYLIGSAANWFKAWQRGSLATELKHGAAATIGDAAIYDIPGRGGTRISGEPAALRAALLLPRVGAFFGHEMGRIMNTIMSPLFDNIIPKVKMSAWADEMSTWLRNNPLATKEATLSQARKLTDSMDDRFGEMVQDNLFWPRALKQSLNLNTVSVGWEYGTLRAFGGAAKDILTGNVLSTRARWLLSFPVVMGLSSSIYQYLKTGQLPWQTETPVRDLIAPRTGGQTPEGAPERALLPGYEKDPLQWYNALNSAQDVTQLPAAVATIAGHKLNPFASTIRGTITGTDWQGNPIYSQVPDPQTNEIPPGWLDYVKFVGEQLEPIVAEQPRLRGTAITPAERLGGLRPAPEFIQNPERVENAQQRSNRYQERQEIRRTKRQNSRLEEPPE